MSDKKQESRPFGQHLKMERVRLGLNQTELAAIGQVSKATQVAYESNSTRPDIGYLAKIGEAGVDVFMVLYGRRVTAPIQWDLLLDILALIEEWMLDRPKPTSSLERNDLLRTLYAQFCSEGRINPEQLATTFRLVK